MLRLLRKSFGTYSKSSLDFKDSKCLIAIDHKVENFIGLYIRSMHIYPFTSFMIFGFSFSSIALASMCILSNIPLILIHLSVLKPSIKKLYLLEDCQTIEVLQVFSKNKLTFDIKNLKRIGNDEESSENLFKKYSFEVDGNIFHIPCSSKIKNEDLLTDIINAEEIRLIED